MTSIIPKLKKTGPWLACIAAVAMVIVGVIFSHTPYFHAYSTIQIPFFGPFNSTTASFLAPGDYKHFLRTVFDESVTQAVSNISYFVPGNETLIVTTTSAVPVIKYFTGHPTTRIPSNVTSYDSLLQYMSRNNFSYLVIPKRSDQGKVESLTPLFISHNVPLKKDFLKIGDFKATNSRIFLYKKIGGS
jgi:hypothetical protein